MLEERLTLSAVNAVFGSWLGRGLFDRSYKELEGFAVAVLGTATAPHPDNINSELPSDAFYKHVLWQAESRTTPARRRRGARRGGDEEDDEPDVIQRREGVPCRGRLSASG